MSRTPDERNSLVERINRLEFQEYRRVGWLKAATFHDLLAATRHSCVAAHRSAVARYIRGDADDAVRRTVLGAFLAEWLPDRTPESMGGWGSEADFVRCNRSEALRRVDEVLWATSQDPEARVGKRLAWLEPDDEHDEGTVPYEQLRAWFAEELLDIAVAVYYVYAPAHDAGHYRGPRVIGMDRRVVAMFWLE